MPIMRAPVWRHVGEYRRLCASVANSSQSKHQKILQQQHHQAIRHFSYTTSDSAASTQEEEENPEQPRGTALIVGAGDALGSALAHKFAQEGLIVCAMRRNQEKLVTLQKDIMKRQNLSGADDKQQQLRRCEIYPADARNEEEMNQVVQDIESNIGPIEIAVHNIGANVRYGLLDPKMTSRKYFKVWEMAALSAFHMGRAVAAPMKERQQNNSQDSGGSSSSNNKSTILFTGATASLRGGSKFAAFSGAMSAKRALAQSMAREFGPQGIHVAHIVIDGGIQTEFVKGIIGEETFTKAVQNDALLTPEAIAENYWYLHQQPRVAWTHELDLRPWLEKW